MTEDEEDAGRHIDQVLGPLSSMMAEPFGSTSCEEARR